MLQRLDLQVLVLDQCSKADRFVFGHAQDFLGVGESLVALVAHQPEHLVLILLRIYLLPAVSIDVFEGRQLVIVVQRLLQHDLNVGPLQLVRVLERLEGHLVAQHLPMLEL